MSWTIGSQESDLVRSDNGHRQPLTWMAQYGYMQKRLFVPVPIVPPVGQNPFVMDSTHGGPSYRSKSLPFGVERPHEARLKTSIQVACA